MQKKLEELFTNTPPYKKVKLTTSEFISINNIEEKIKIDDYCENCGTEKVFVCGLNTQFKTIKQLAINSKLLPYADSEKIKKHLINSINANNCKTTIFEFVCAKCGEKHYFSVLLESDFIVKYGQYPSYSTQNVKKVEKYKNLISKYYPELTKSLNAYSQGMGVASFVYLRRILEWIVEEKCSDDEKTLKFVDKLKRVEEREKIIPDILEEIKNQIYTVLSKGVHEYSEDDCLNMYDAVFFVIESILENELMKKEKEKRANEVKKAIASRLKTTN